ncbi:MAG: nucleotidyl transferase AbiEii/AbiGii toxin family protein [Chloroflexota bacterium]
MTVPEPLASLIEPLTALQHLLDGFDSQGVVIGGVATGFLGKPRFTVDLDAMFLASTKDIDRILEMAKEDGIEPRTEKVMEFARKSRVLLLRHTASRANIDISLGILPFEEEVVARSIVRNAGALSVRLPTPEDLIIMKAVAHRPKDLLDIQAVVENHPDLDVARIKNWVRQFAEVLEMPSLWDDIEGMLK